MAAFERFVGVDWGSENHHVCVLAADRAVLLDRAFAHTGQALHDMVDAVLEGSEPSRVAVAIETPRGPVVETLLERGVTVFAINPKQLDRFRDRHTTASAKDDRRDAFVLADSLRTDAAAFHEVKASSALYVQLRELSRLHEELIAERVACGNRLVEQPRRYYPQPLSLDSVGNSPWLWAVLELAPTPAAAKRTSLAKFGSILKAHRIRRHSPELVKTTLTTRPLSVGAGVAEAAEVRVRSLIARLRLVHDELRNCERRVDELFEALAREAAAGVPSDAQIVRSIPGVGPVVGATLLVEAEASIRERDYRTLRALAGVAPVTRATGKRSGKHAAVNMRRACNKRLRNAVHYWIHSAIGKDPKVKARYAAQRARGHSHGRAIRGVGDRMLGVLIAMLQKGTLYQVGTAPTCLEEKA
ncbi:MAG: IS110 family transposase [Polyangiaceae bacterium]